MWKFEELVDGRWLFVAEYTWWPAVRLIQERLIQERTAYRVTYILTKGEEGREQCCES